MINVKNFRQQKLLFKRYVNKTGLALLKNL